MKKNKETSTSVPTLANLKYFHGIMIENWTLLVLLEAIKNKKTFKYQQLNIHIYSPSY